MESKDKVILSSERTGYFSILHDDNRFENITVNIDRNDIEKVFIKDYSKITGTLSSADYMNFEHYIGLKGFLKIMIERE